MAYKRQGAPGNLDADGVRKYTEEQLLQIQRATSDMDQSVADLQTVVDDLIADFNTLNTRVGTLGDEIRQTFSVALGASATPQNVQNIVVTPGTWDLTAIFRFIAGGATNATDWQAILSENPALSMLTSVAGIVLHERRPAGLDHVVTLVHAPYRVTYAVNTTVYARAQATWSVAPAYSVMGWLRALRVKA